jgi:hypothetical protein
MKKTNVLTGCGHTLSLVWPPFFDHSEECVRLAHDCAIALVENKISKLSINISSLSAKHISIIRDTMKKHDCIVETSSMYETEILTFERKK